MPIRGEVRIMAKLRVEKSDNGGRRILVNEKEIDDVMSVTIYVSPGSAITANIEVGISEADIQD